VYHLFGSVVLATDFDEERNSLWIGVSTDATPGQLRALAQSHGMPAGMMTLEHFADLRALRGDIRDTVRPIVGGAKISLHEFGVDSARKWCTVGFNVRLPNDANEYFVTNAHCTMTMFGPDSAQAYQPYSNYPGAFYQTPIGIEVYDPPLSSSLPGCPSGTSCRYSDAALFRYINGAPHTFAGIAKTAYFSTGFNTDGSFDQTATFTNIGEVADSNWIAADLGNIYVHKIGMRTGWTWGAFSRSCVNVGSGGGVLLCQQFSYTYANEGDSGSPAFWWVCCGTNQTSLVGIVHSAIPPSNEMGFSTIAGVKNDLGALITY